MPVGGIASGHRPTDCGPGQAGPDMHVVADIVGIVVISEGLSMDGIVHSHNSDNEQKCKKDVSNKRWGRPDRTRGMTLLARFEINRGHTFAPKSCRFERARLQACRNSGQWNRL